VEAVRRECTKVAIWDQYPTIPDSRAPGVYPHPPNFNPKLGIWLGLGLGLGSGIGIGLGSGLGLGLGLGLVV